MEKLAKQFGVTLKSCAIVGDDDVYPTDEMYRKVNLLLNKLINEKGFNSFYICPFGAFEWMVRRILSDLQKYKYPHIITFLLEPYDDFTGDKNIHTRLVLETEVEINLVDRLPLHRPSQIQSRCTGIDHSEFVIFGLGNEDMKNMYEDYTKKQFKKYEMF